VRNGLVFDWVDLYGLNEKPKPEPPKFENISATRKKPKYATVFVGLLLGFLGCVALGYDSPVIGFSLAVVSPVIIMITLFRSGFTDERSSRWGYEPRAGWPPDRGGGV